MPQQLTALLFLLLQLLYTVQASTWDPHVFPSSREQAPFFEGWYVRVVLPSSSESLAVICGAGLLKEGLPPSAIPVYLAILHGQPTDNNNTSGGHTTRVYERTASALEQVSVVSTQGGSNRNVTEEPSWKYPPLLPVATTRRGEGEEEEEEESTLSTEGDMLSLNFHAGGASVKMVVQVSPWVSDGSPHRPHSWTDIIEAVPLHWYIHSLSSSLVSLDLHTPDGRHLILPPASPPPTGGLVHLEKNWGRAFPSAWVWIQGLVTTTTSSSSNGTLAVTASWAPDALAPGVAAHLAYVRDDEHGLAWDLKPDNSRVTHHEIDSCAGKVRLVVQSLGGKRELALEVEQPEGSAGSLLGPTQQGFQRLCAESFHATARVTLRTRARWGGKQEVVRRETVVTQVALEFGGDLLCRTTTPPAQAEGGGGGGGGGGEESAVLRE